MNRTGQVTIVLSVILLAFAQNVRAYQEPDPPVQVERSGAVSNISDGLDLDFGILNQLFNMLNGSKRGDFTISRETQEDLERDIAETILRMTEGINRLIVLRPHEEFEIFPAIFKLLREAAEIPGGDIGFKFIQGPAAAKLRADAAAAVAQIILGLRLTRFHYQLVTHSVEIDSEIVRDLMQQVAQIPADNEIWEKIKLTPPDFLTAYTEWTFPVEKFPEFYNTSRDAPTTPPTPTPTPIPPLPF